MALLHLEKYDESLKIFEKAISIDSTFAPSLYNKGIVLDKLGDHTQAQSYKQKALQINPDIEPGKLYDRFSIVVSVSSSSITVPHHDVTSKSAI